MKRKEKNGRKETQGRMEKQKKDKRKKILRAAVFVCALGVLIRFIPYPELEAYRLRSYGAAVYDRNGVVLRVFPAVDGVKREWASLQDVPKGAVKVFLRAEDRRFYLHPGIDPIAILRSFIKNIRAKRIVSGASTITMQTARLIRPHGYGLRGKLSEVWDALRLEARLSKKQILELWLNGIPFGSNIEGLPAITRARFGRPIAMLDDSRAVLLAVIPRRPGRYDPAVNPETAATAAIQLSAQAGLHLSEESIRKAAREAGAYAPEKTPFLAPHFAERIFSLLPSSSSADSKKFSLGKRKKETNEEKERITTLDTALQTFAEERLSAELAQLKNNRVTNGAVFAIENETGAVRIYAGSASWFDENASGRIDGVQTRNQPGSCLKPFLYALALDSGFTPADILPDIPTVFGTSEAYIPGNFNRRFNGPVRFRVALASSLNIPAVYLLERIGVSAFEEYLCSLGFDSIADRKGTHGSGLALGNAEVSLEELVRAFAVFPRGGSAVSLRWFENAAVEKDSNAVMSAYAARMIADILSDSSSRFVGFGPAPSLSAPFPAMFKTGTANQYQHIWALGATKRYTAGVWMGNFSGETVIGKTGSSIPGRIVSAVLAALENGKALPLAESLEDAEAVEICALSGMRAGQTCTGTLAEWFPRNRPPEPCSWHRDGFLAYPPEYRAWLAESFYAAEPETGAGAIRIPVSGSVFYRDPALPPEAQGLRLETAGFGQTALVYLDGALQGRLNSGGVFVLPLIPGGHTVTVEDETAGRSSARFEVR